MPTKQEVPEWIVLDESRGFVFSVKGRGEPKVMSGLLALQILGTKCLFFVNVLVTVPSGQVT